MSGCWFVREVEDSMRVLMNTTCGGLCNVGVETHGKGFRLNAFLRREELVEFGSQLSVGVEVSYSLEGLT